MLKIFILNKMTKQLFNIFASFIIGLSILLPVALVEVKICILLIAIFFAVLLSIKGHAQLSSKTLMLAIFYALLGLSWSLYGIHRDNPGAVSVLSVMAVYPLLFTLLSATYKATDGAKIGNLFISLSILICALNLVYISGFILVPGNPFHSAIDYIYKDAAVVDAENGYFKFTIPNISSCLFLFPFLVAKYITSKDRRFLTGLALLGMIFIMFASGRRAYFISSIAGVVFSFLLTRNCSNGGNTNDFNIKGLFFAIVAAVAGISLFVDYEKIDFYIQQIGSIFDFESDESNLERANQFYSLTSGFADHPLWGAGAGASAKYIRSTEQPWAYELSYVAFLFQYGLVGFLLYAAGLIILCLNIVELVREKGRQSFEFAYLSGFISFMVANATNPYLAKFDYMWVIFIPVAFMNERFLEGRFQKAVRTRRINDVK